MLLVIERSVPNEPRTQGGSRKGVAMSDKYAKLKQLNQAVVDAKHAAYGEFKEIFKVGDKVRWVKNNSIQSGEILMVRYDQSLIVKNVLYETEYTIQLWQVLEAERKLAGGK